MLKIIKSNIYIIFSIVLVILVISGAMYFSNKNNSESSERKYMEETVEENINNVSIENGKQIIEIRAKGGYRPVHSIAKAGIPTILRINTNGTFDCSSSVRIPSMGIGQNLPLSGTTDIDLGVQKVTTLQGTCGMGMYPFDIKFE